jgi:hypothetical protein
VPVAELGTAADPGFGEQVGHMRLDRTDREEQLLGDLALLRPAVTAVSTSSSRLVIPKVRSAGGTVESPRPRRVGAPARRNRSRQNRASFSFPEASNVVRSAWSCGTGSPQPSATAHSSVNSRRKRCHHGTGVRASSPIA